MPVIELTCRRCGEAFTPTHEAIIRGPDWYWLCPRCRPDSEPTKEIAR